MRELSTEQLAFYLDYFSDFSDHQMYANLLNMYEKRSKTTAGHKVENFSLPDQYGNMVSLSDFSGKWLLVDFWFVNCVWCRRMTPHLKNIYNDWHEKRDFEILGFSVDTPGYYNQWLEAVDHEGASWKQVLDSTRTVAENHFGVMGYPTMFLIDKEGRGTIVIGGYNEENILRKKLGQFVKERL